MTTISRTENDRAAEPLAGAALSAPNPTAIARSVRGWSSFREPTRAREPDWFNAPVPSFGDPEWRGC